MWFCPRYPRFHRLQLKDFYTRAPLPTSLPTNQGSPLITIVLTSPKRSSFENLNFHIHSKLSIINYQLSISECFAWAQKRKAPATRYFHPIASAKLQQKKHFMTETPRSATNYHEMPRNATNAILTCFCEITKQVI